MSTVHLCPATRPAAARGRLLPGLAALAAVLLTLVAVSTAQALTVDISGPGAAKANLLLSKPMGEDANAKVPSLAADLQSRIDTNLTFMPFLHSMAPSEVLGGDAVAVPKAPGIDFKRLALSKVDFLVTSAWKEPTLPGKPQVALRVYESYQGGFLFGQEYADVRPEELQDIADRFCARLMEILTGRKGFFGSKLAFARRDVISKEIFVAGPTGTGARRITSMGGTNTSPTWSPDGRRIAFTHIGDKGHQIGIADAASGKVDLKDVPGGAAISPVYMPDGRLTLGMDVRDDMNIYIVDGSMHPVKPLTEGYGISVSPTFDASGKLMAFASGRFGNPHIFLQDMGSGQVTRVTYEGKYNTKPTLSPDGTMVAFARDGAEGHRIYVRDLGTGQERQVSFGPGFDEDPTFGPDNYSIVFSSNRAGEYKLYLTTINGDPAVMLQTGPGEATAPDWSRVQ